MNSGKEHLHQSCRSGGLLYKAILLFFVVSKLVISVCSFLSSDLHNKLIAYSSYSIPFLLASMHSEKVAAEYSIIVIVFLSIILIVWIVLPILVIMNGKVFSVAVISFTVLNSLDLISCLLSYSSIPSGFKIIGILFNAFLIIVNSLLFWKLVA